MTWNNLKRPTANKKRPEKTYTNKQETTWNDPQRVRHNLQRPEPTYNKQKKEVKQPTQADFEIILQYGAISFLL